MSHNGIPSVDDLGIIPSLIEHSHIHAQVVCKINGPVHSSLIRAYDHQMILVDADGLIMLENCLHKLIGGHEVVQTGKGDGILHPRIMGVKGNNVMNTHMNQLFQGHGAVQGFPVGPLMLPAFIKEWHNHVNPVGR